MPADARPRTASGERSRTVGGGGGGSSTHGRCGSGARVPADGLRPERTSAVSASPTPCPARCQNSQAAVRRKRLAEQSSHFVVGSLREIVVPETDRVERVGLQYAD